MKMGWRFSTLKPVAGMEKLFADLQKKRLSICEEIDANPNPPKHLVPQRIHEQGYLLAIEHVILSISE